jgi:hypothetical protein
MGITNTTNPDTYLDRHFNGFYHGTPKAGNKSIIMVVVDHLSKVAHFYALAHPFTLSLVAA